MKQIKMMEIQTQNLGFMLLIAIMVSSCGFHLRGEITLPSLYERVYVIDKGYSDIGKSLERSLENVGSQIVSSTQAASSVITILSRGTQRRALNVGGNEIREYELQLTIRFVVQDHEGRQLSTAQTVTVLRNYQNDPDAVLSKDNEEQILRKEMMQPAMIQILRRLKAIAK